MIQQPKLPFGLPPFQRHSETSREASISIYPRVGTQRRIVLDYLRQRGDLGATDDEMQVALDMNPSTQRPRRVELERGELVVKTAMTRPTRAGRKAAVYVAA